MKTKKLSPTQAVYLSRKVQGLPTAQHGNNGGFVRTRNSLQRAGLLDWQFNVTSDGRVAHLEGRYFDED